jgi:hypothetical protein
VFANDLFFIATRLYLNSGQLAKLWCVNTFLIERVLENTSFVDSQATELLSRVVHLNKCMRAEWLPSSAVVASTLRDYGCSIMYSYLATSMRDDCAVRLRCSTTLVLLTLS